MATTKKRPDRSIKAVNGRTIARTRHGLGPLPTAKIAVSQDLSLFAVTLQRILHPIAVDDFMLGGAIGGLELIRGCARCRRCYEPRTGKTAVSR